MVAQPAFVLTEGVVWPDSGTPTPSSVGDVFGPRPFSPHVSTVGYDYDFHRGIDLPIAQGGQVYSPVDGFVIRRHYTHFQWEFAENLAEFSEQDDDALVAASVDTVDQTLDLAWTAVPAVSSTGFAEAAKLVCRSPLNPDGDDCDVQLELEAVMSSGTAMAVGVFLWNQGTGEWAAIDHDGSTITTFAVDADGADLTNDGATAANADATWLRVFFDQSAGNLLFQRSTDGDSWTTVGTWGSPNWTISGCPAMHFGVYLRKTQTATEAQTGTVSINFLGAVDDETIGRFGNWVTIARPGRKYLLMHMEHLDCPMGRIRAGAPVGRAGNTGFDSRSGRVISTHAHVELIENNHYLYANDDPVNPLAPVTGGLPRADVTSNVSVVRTEENDPNGDACFKLAITVTRADQDFDVNVIALNAGGTQRQVNFDTRNGLNADTDVPDENGVYLVAYDFDDESTTYRLDAYFEKAVVGSTFVSASIRDARDAVLWSE